MRGSDQSCSGGSGECFERGEVCGREIHGVNAISMGVKCCEGKEGE